MLLLPEPFGPEIETNPGSNSTTVFLNPNDLKPNISTFLICTNRTIRNGPIIITANKFS